MGKRSGEDEELDDEEKKAKYKLIELCKDIADDFGDAEEEED
jgi:hypothetical protein